MQSCAARAATRAALAVARPRSILLMGGGARGPGAAAASSLSPLAPPQSTLRSRAGAARAASSSVAAAAATAAAPTSTSTTTSKPLPTRTSPSDWAVRMLYDGECALCMKEVDFLRKRDAQAGKIDFVDIASDAYRAEDNCGIDYETAMAKIHAIRPDGEVLTGIAVFRALYEAVGLGWVYSATSRPAVERAANAVYDFWAKYRTRVTGREDMGEIFEARRRRLAAVGAAGGGDDDLAGSECRVDGSGCGSDGGKGGGSVVGETSK